MNFTNLYPIYHKMPIGCDIKKKFKIKHIVVGSGGSNNLIIAIVNDNGVWLIIKVIPDMVYENAKIKPDHDQLEIKFYQFFTQKYILTDRTPHIVGMFSHWECDKFEKFLRNVLPGKGACPSYSDKLTKKLDITFVKNIMCDLLLRHELKMIHSAFDMLLLEFCPLNMTRVIYFLMDSVHNATGKEINMSIMIFTYVLRRLLFQLIFTLAIVKDDYPGFLHGDFFLRNILVSMEEGHEPTEFVAYHYEQRIFYLEANGEYAKINDFGETIIANELEPSTYKIDKPKHRYRHLNSFNQKSDIFNLLHDIYDGEGLGTISISDFAEKIGLSKDKMKPIRKFLSEFIKVNTIDKINRNNRQLLNMTWHIDQIKILEDTVRTPHQYLTDGTFKFFQKLPTDGKVIRHFNKPK